MIKAYYLAILSATDIRKKHLSKRYSVSVSPVSL